ncbi:Legumain [Folsomia candida]|uniref:legumain n=1 Tax=Folsomia candida TaxID=158441 RepID=A0A226ETP3_FOLCA|nr:Legumain [Folsomia candida]
MGTILRSLGLLLLVSYGTFAYNKDIYQVKFPNEHEEQGNLLPKIKQDAAVARDPYKVNGNGTIWAVLVAGSNGYYNYRHQADICHAYQILLRNGVAKEHIIVLMFDDVANSEENPTPGVIINRPNGPNVYAGVEIDYKGDDVKPDVFLKVLLGDEKSLRGVGTGRVLKSGPDDHVFINFADHGAPGLVAFPSEELHAQDLISTIKKMHLTKMYAKMVLYVEACEIFATTAANDVESSYACYMDDYRETYLGDVYSIKWMENSDQANLEQETLQKQFLIVRNETNTSHVMEFGDKSLRRLPVAQFLGESEPERKVRLPEVELNAVESSEVVREILERKLILSNSTEQKKNLRWKLKRFHKLRKLVKTEMKEIVSKVTKGLETEMKVLEHTRMPITNWDCYEQTAKYYSRECFSIAKNPYVTRQLYLLANMCERGWGADAIQQAMSSTCNHSSLQGIN